MQAQNELLVGGRHAHVRQAVLEHRNRDQPQQRSKHVARAARDADASQEHGGERVGIVAVGKFGFGAAEAHQHEERGDGRHRAADQEEHELDFVRGDARIDAGLGL